MQHSLAERDALSFDELDRELVDVLPAREEFVTITTTNTNSGVIAVGASGQTGVFLNVAAVVSGS